MKRLTNLGILSVMFKIALIGSIFLHVRTINPNNPPPNQQSILEM